MTKILIITVGCAPKPILTALETLQPDRVIFICSMGKHGTEKQITGTGFPCIIRKGTEIIKELPNIPTHAKLGDRFDVDRDLIKIEDPDNLLKCYQKVVLKIQEIHKEFPNAHIMADYTGGTKTMSVALAMVVLDHPVELYLTTAKRSNTTKVEIGEMTSRATITPLVVQRTIEQFIPVVLQQYNYSAAIAELKRLLISGELSPEIQTKIKTLNILCTGFEAWDRFEHQDALSFLEPHINKKEINPLCIFLKKIINSRGQIDEKFNTSDGTKGHGYEIVQDLLLNAERCSKQKRYDDATGRLYRALELLAQIRLRMAYEIKTGDVDLNKLPKSLQDEYEKMRSPSKGKIQLALRNSYELLTKFPQDPIGKLYQKSASSIIHTLETRNNSLFAHGFQPIVESDYERVSDVFVTFIQDCITQAIPSKKLEAIQFPTNLSLI